MCCACKCRCYFMFIRSFRFCARLFLAWILRFFSASWCFCSAGDNRAGSAGTENFPIKLRYKGEASSGCYDPSRLRCSPSTGTHFLFVQLAMGFEGDVEISSALLLKGALPLLSFPPGGKAACAFLLSLPLPVLKANHGISAAILFVLTDGHLLRRPRPM